MTRTLLAVIGSFVLLGAMIFMLASGDKKRLSPASGAELEPIVLFCAASNRAVMEEIRSEYEAEFGREVQIQYGPSQTLLSQVEVGGTGDLYLPADDSYLKVGREKELIAEVLPIAKMQGVIAVQKDNPKHITKLEDLLREDVQFAQANPDAAAIGKLTRDVLQAQSKWDTVDEATDAYRTTVTDVANDLLVGAADAGIVFDAVLHTYPQLSFVEIPELADANAQISVGVLKSSKQPTVALHFARYVSARDRGLVHYAEQGFRATDGDEWADVPKLAIFAGSMLRPAIEDTIVAFEEREGIEVSRVYNGCGILLSQMEAGEIPDAFFACDTEFMDQVTDLFPEPIPVSQNQLVILVAKGNPHQIASLRDLTKQGLRVGIGHEKQCAMGWITQNTFREGGIQEEVMANVTVQTPTGDMLVNQMRTGSLDAAVVYLSNAAGAADVLDAIQIQGLQCSVATQPWAVRKESKHPQLAGRLFEKICSVESQETFAAEGFGWKLGQPTSSAASSSNTVTSSNAVTSSNTVTSSNAAKADVAQ